MRLALAATLIAAAMLAGWAFSAKPADARNRCCGETPGGVMRCWDC